MSDILLIGSCEPFSGKSALVLGIAKKIIDSNKKVRIGKPLATCIELTNLPSMAYEGLIDDDVKFISSTLNIDEKNLISLNTKDLREKIALVQQQPFLFSGKIIDIIRMGRDFTKEEVIESAKKANAHYFIQKLPEKYETKINERGSNFSGGQIQRIAIARAILGNPSILLLDEATSALDAESESEVREGLNRAMKDRTVIVIAHRLATTQNADRIVVFDKGEIIEVGKHIDLINKKGVYKELCEKQLIDIM